MKYNGLYSKQINITQHEGGYVIQDIGFDGRQPQIFVSFEETVDRMAKWFGLTEIGERVVISSTFEKKEVAEQGRCGNE